MNLTSKKKKKKGKKVKTKYLNDTKGELRLWHIQMNE